MKVNKSLPPVTVERELNIELTREETLSILVAYVKNRLGQNMRLENLTVEGEGDQNKLTSVKLIGVEIVPLNWKSDSIVERMIAPTVPTNPPVVPAPTTAPALVNTDPKNIPPGRK